jgi:hypothetical protein
MPASPRHLRDVQRRAAEHSDESQGRPSSEQQQIEEPAPQEPSQPSTLESSGVTTSTALAAASVERRAHSSMSVLQPSRDDLPHLEVRGGNDVDRSFSPDPTPYRNRQQPQHPPPLAPRDASLPESPVSTGPSSPNQARGARAQVSTPSAGGGASSVPDDTSRGSAVELWATKLTPRSVAANKRRPSLSSNLSSVPSPLNRTGSRVHLTAGTPTGADAVNSSSNSNGSFTDRVDPLPVATPVAGGAHTTLTPCLLSSSLSAGKRHNRRTSVSVVEPMTPNQPRRRDSQTREFVSSLLHTTADTSVQSSIPEEFEMAPEPASAGLPPAAAGSGFVRRSPYQRRRSSTTSNPSHARRNSRRHSRTTVDGGDDFALEPPDVHSRTATFVSTVGSYGVDDDMDDDQDQDTDDVDDEDRSSSQVTGTPSLSPFPKSPLRRFRFDALMRSPLSNSQQPIEESGLADVPTPSDKNSSTRSSLKGTREHERRVVRNAQAEARREKLRREREQAPDSLENSSNDERTPTGVSAATKHRRHTTFAPSEKSDKSVNEEVMVVASPINDDFGSPGDIKISLRRPTGFVTDTAGAQGPNAPDMPSPNTLGLRSPGPQGAGFGVGHRGSRRRNNNVTTPGSTPLAGPAGPSAAIGAVVPPGVYGSSPRQRQLVDVSVPHDQRQRESENDDEDDGAADPSLTSQQVMPVASGRAAVLALRALKMTGRRLSMMSDGAAGDGAVNNDSTQNGSGAFAPWAMSDLVSPTNASGAPGIAPFLGFRRDSGMSRRSSEAPGNISGSNMPGNVPLHQRQPRASPFHTGDTPHHRESISSTRRESSGTTNTARRESTTSRRESSSRRDSSRSGWSAASMGITPAHPPMHGNLTASILRSGGSNQMISPNVVNFSPGSVVNAAGLANFSRRQSRAGGRNSLTPAVSVRSRQQSVATVMTGAGTPANLLLSTLMETHGLGSPLHLDLGMSQLTRNSSCTSISNLPDYPHEAITRGDIVPPLPLGLGPGTSQLGVTAVVPGVLYLGSRRQVFAAFDRPDTANTGSSNSLVQGVEEESPVAPSAPRVNSFAKKPPSPMLARRTSSSVTGSDRGSFQKSSSSRSTGSHSRQHPTPPHHSSAPRRISRGGNQSPSPSSLSGAAPAPAAAGESLMDADPGLTASMNIVTSGRTSPNVLNSAGRLCPFTLAGGGFLCVAKELANNPFPTGAHNACFLPLPDTAETKLIEHLPAVFTFINENASRGHPVVLYCWKGKSRSVSFALAYLMWRWRIPEVGVAMALLRKAYKDAEPNTSFLMQLAMLTLEDLDRCAGMVHTGAPGGAESDEDEEPEELKVDSKPSSHNNVPPAPHAQDASPTHSRSERSDASGHQVKFFMPVTGKEDQPRTARSPVERSPVDRRLTVPTPVEGDLPGPMPKPLDLGGPSFQPEHHPRRKPAPVFPTFAKSPASGPLALGKSPASRPLHAPPHASQRSPLAQSLAPRRMCDVDGANGGDRSPSLPPIPEQSAVPNAGEEGQHDEEGQHGEPSAPSTQPTPYEENFQIDELPHNHISVRIHRDEHVTTTSGESSQPTPTAAANAREQSLLSASNGPMQITMTAASPWSGGAGWSLREAGSD